MKRTNIDEWRSQFEAVLERIRANVPADVGSDDSEAEITAAWEEVRRERVNQRSAPSSSSN
ncbi:MAG TPA: hypothetical protein VFZ25_14440 [Chloroflexota bacterium]|nr:hypothetical protein [Chloroflexota bacterium]